MRKLLTLLMVFALAGAASAATVEMWVEGSGPYDVVARLEKGSLSDNAGLALLNVTLSGAGTITNQLPMIQVGTFPAAGFTMFRSGTGTNPANPVGAAQNSIGDPGIGTLNVYGLGLGTVDMATVVGGATYTPSQVIEREMVVASCTALPTITDVTAVVYTVLDVPEGPADTYLADYVIVPEPATLGLLALGGLALIRRRK